MLWLSLFTWAALAQDCPAPVHAEQVGADVEEAMLAFATLDEDGFRASSSHASAELPCVSDVMLPQRVAAYHRMMGVLAFLNADPTAAQRSFAAALSIEPDYALSAKIAPEGGRLWRAYDGAKTLTVSGPKAFKVPDGPHAYTNGAYGNTRIAELPAIIQLADGATIVSTTYVAGGTPVPALPASAPAHPAVATAATTPGPAVGDDLPDDAAEPDEPDEPVVEDLDDPAPKHTVEHPVEHTSEPAAAVVKPPKEPAEHTSSHKPTMWIAAGASGGAAVALFATSAITRSSFDANPTAGKFGLTNGAYYGSVGATVLALGFSGLAISGTF